MKDLVFVDVETTGLDPDHHELIEVAAVRVHPHTLEPLDHLSLRVVPDRLGDADPRALEVNGYNDADWRDAVSLGNALRRLAPLLEGAVVAGHNVAFDWAFLVRGFARTGVPLPPVDYHRVDTASLAWPLVSGAETASLSLDAVCAALGLSRPSPHRATIMNQCRMSRCRLRSKWRRRPLQWVAGVTGPAAHRPGMAIAVFGFAPVSRSATNLKSATNLSYRLVEVRDRHQPIPRI